MKSPRSIATARRAGAVLCAVLCAGPAAAVLADGVGGGPVPAPPAAGHCVGEAERAAVLDRLARSGPLAPRPADPRATALTLYEDPMPGGMNSFGRTVTNYVDLDPAAGLRDWNCGAVTYDGHQGIDIEIRDFYDMDEGVALLCAAPGTVVAAHDGEFDRRTAWTGGALANYAIVQHADGSLAYYWHMRRGSVRVAPGNAVASGDTLGFVGSSGFSSGPHIHFETQLPGMREPHAGACQASPSLWVSQPPYVWTHAAEIFNHGLTTLALDWPTICERPPSKTHVVANSVVRSWIRARNLTTSTLITWRFFSPAGQWAQYSFYPNGNYTSSWWYINWTLNPASNLYGAWRVEISLDGALVATQPFTLDAVPNQLPTIAPRTVTVPADGRVEVDLAGTDPDGAVFWHNMAVPPWQGTYTLGGTRRHVLTYVPAPGFTGLDSMQVRAVDDQNAAGPAAVIRFDVRDVTAVGEGAARGLALAPPAPNPLARDSRIAFTLPAPGDARLEVLDVGGRRVARWEAGGLAAGGHAVAWEALAGARALPAGLYFVRLAAGGESRVRRVSVTE